MLYQLSYRGTDSEIARVVAGCKRVSPAVGAGEQRPVVRNGALAIATQMSCTLSCDHRVVDGVLGAQFLNVFKGFIENPLTMDRDEIMAALAQQTDFTDATIRPRAAQARAVTTSS